MLSFLSSLLSILSAKGCLSSLFVFFLLELSFENFFEHSFKHSFMPSFELSSELSSELSFEHFFEHFFEHLVKLSSDSELSSSELSSDLSFVLSVRHRSLLLQILKILSNLGLSKMALAGQLSTTGQ